MMNESTRNQVVARLRRIAGQVEGIARMVEQDRYCVDLLLQLASVQAAVGQVQKIVLSSHVETCVTEVIESGTATERKRKLDELMALFARYACLGSQRAKSK